MKNLILGYKGFVGSNIMSRMTNCEGIGRGDKVSKKKYETVIDCRSFFSRGTIFDDSTIIDDGHVFNCRRYIFISSIDAVHLQDAYGYHKKFQEELVKAKYRKDYLILRCGSIFGDNLKKGFIKDAIDGYGFYTEDSMFRLTGIEQIIDSLNMYGVVNCFSRDVLTQKEARRYYDVECKKKGRVHVDYSKHISDCEFSWKDCIK